MQGTCLETALEKLGDVGQFGDGMAVNVRKHAFDKASKQRGLGSPGELGSGDLLYERMSLYSTRFDASCLGLDQSSGAPCKRIKNAAHTARCSGYGDVFHPLRRIARGVSEPS